MGGFTRVGKQILARGFHYADAADDTAAEHILSRLAGWQPIDTAPRDRQVILFNRQLGDVDVGYWCNVIGEPTVGFWEIYGGYPWSVEAVTHWMPLPTPPVEG